MEVLQTALIILVFIAMALSMFFRVIPALIALPVMAILIAVFGGVTLSDTINYVIGEGSLKLSTAYTIAIFGSMLSVLLQKTGVAESFIKKGAELSGDNPWTIAVLMLVLIILLFTTLGGLGAIIMVATIVLPIMSSVGLSSITVVGIFLLGLSIGGTLNVGNWAVYIDVMGLSVSEVKPFALIIFSLSFVAALVYITVQLYRDGQELDLKKIIIRTSVILSSLAILILIYNNFLLDHTRAMIINLIIYSYDILKYLISLIIIILFIRSTYSAIKNKNELSINIHWTAYLIPMIPLLLILLYDINFIAAFILGLIYAFISTYKKGQLNIFIKSIFEGGGVVMPAVALMFGIGMLLVAIMGPSAEITNYPNGWPVLNLLKPLMEYLIPSGKLAYILIFTAFAPLALYRGPLNVWGMGYGLAAVFLASGMNPGAVMGLLLSVGQIQGISDPTNTHNVWLANEMRVDVQKVLWNTIPYTWALAFLGLIISALLFII